MGGKLAIIMLHPTHSQPVYRMPVAHQRKAAFLSLLQMFVLAMTLLQLSTAPAWCDNPGDTTTAGMRENLGGNVPLELMFRDESGAPVQLSALITKPTIILPVYYSCSNVCAYQQGRMAGTLPLLQLQPGIDYQVISISFDENDTPELAARSKRTYLTAMRKPFPPEGWRFLTADRATIARFTTAIGYGFQRQGKEFIHPVVSVVVSSRGTIIRYLYGIAVLPKDLTLALSEAKSGISGASVRKLLEYCFSYDPQANSYVFNLLKVSATAVILCLAGFGIFLMLTGKQKRDAKRKPL